MPQKAFEGGIFHVRAYAAYDMHFFLKCPIFRIRWEKWGISGKTNIKKWGISRKKHVINFKTRKEPKMNMFDFGAFQEKLHMLSRAKYLLQRLVGAFQDTPLKISDFPLMIRPQVPPFQFQRLFLGFFDARLSSRV